MKKLALGLFLLATLQTVAQTGTPRFAAIQNGGLDKIDQGNLNFEVAFPLVSVASRGMNFNASLVYNSQIWTSSGTLWTPVLGQSGVASWGWDTQNPVGTAAFNYQRFRCIANDGTNQWSYRLYGFNYREPNGTMHQFGLNFVEAESPGQYPECGDSNPVLTGYESGGTTGYFLDATGWGGHPQNFSPRVIATTGTSVQVNGPSADSNGNLIWPSQLTNETDWRDTIGRTVLKAIAHPTSIPQYTTYQGTDSNGNPQTVTSTYTSFNIWTNFGCGKTEYQATGVQLPTQIQLPNQSSYTIAYEQTSNHPGYYTGRITKITLPTGGYIQYTYSGLVDCTYGTPLGMTRVVNDGTTSATWTYSRSTDVNGNYVTVVTSPDQNDTRYTFGSLAVSVLPSKVEVYQGHVTGGTLLQETDTTYGSPMTVTTKLGSVQKQTIYLFDTYGNITQAAEYDWGSGTPKRTTVYTYVTDPAYVNANITDKVKEIDVYDGSTAGTLVAKTTINYDDSDSAHFVCVTSAAGGSKSCASLVRGNPTRVTKYPVPSNAATAQTTNYQYDSTGNLLKVTDPANDSTTISYADSWANTSCTFTGTSYAYPTMTTNALNQSASATYNKCTGTAARNTDLNSQQTQYAYTSTSPTAGRLSSVTDPLSNVTNLYYPAFTRTESKLTFTAGSTGVVLDNYTTTDGLGRPILSQKLQASGGNYDTAENDYDLVGRAKKTTLPFTAGLGSLSSTAAGVTTLYDALGRPTQVSDSGGGTATYTYPNNDVLVEIGPAPGTEHTKKRQYEYDGLGRLTAVCEVTTGTGSGTCTMANNPVGYWTKYTYNALDEITGVTQSAQGSSQQTRAFTYDGLGRMTSEANPENGTITYTFDSDSTCGTSTTDLVKRQDAALNVSCYHYDALHRVTSITYPSGPYASATASKYFVYDAASISFNGTTNMANAKGRLAEVYTCTSCPGTKITDLAFSYSVRGETTDVYEWTTHSAGWYHVNGSYWPSGSLNQLSSNFASSLVITYGLDAAGRVSPVSASVGTNPVTSTYYNAAGQVTDSTLGTGDSDHYQYDANTGRMNQYKFTVGTPPGNVIGQVNWNPNGSLGSLAITDPFNPTNSQTCSYVHDDLSRIASVNCGSIWSQSFGFDPFGNINKTGSQSFTPTYSNSTNQINGGGYSQSYDANGNLLTINDGTTHTYTWDAEGKQLGIDTLAATYDALGRMVELNSSGSYTETVYGLGGEKLALMSGQTLQQSFVATPSGTAVFTASGLSYFRHADWLGSSRFASTTGRTMYSSSAYAPFGEQYAKAGTNDQNFTGQQPDTAAGLYDFLFRRLSQTQGRWISPDPAGSAAVDFSNPQTLNRYGYVGNRPLVLVDPVGLDEAFPCIVDGGVQCYQYDQVTDGGGFFGGWVPDTWSAGGCQDIYSDGNYVGNTCGNGSATSNSGTAGVMNSQSAQENKPKCVPANLATKALIAAMNAAARLYHKTIGFGLGASGGAGNLVGSAFSISRQVVVSPNGQAAFVTSVTDISNMPFNAVVSPGAGGYGGFQASLSNARVPQDLAGPFLDYGGGGGTGLGGGGDLATGRGTQGQLVGQFTVTIGGGAGGYGHGLSVTNTYVDPICQ